MPSRPPDVQLPRVPTPGLRHGRHLPRPRCLCACTSCLMAERRLPDAQEPPALTLLRHHSGGEGRAQCPRAPAAHQQGLGLFLPGQGSGPCAWGNQRQEPHLPRGPQPQGSSVGSLLPSPRPCLISRAGAQLQSPRRRGGALCRAGPGTQPCTRLLSGAGGQDPQAVPVPCTGTLCPAPQKHHGWERGARGAPDRVRAAVSGFSGRGGSGVPDAWEASAGSPGWGGVCRPSP